MKRLAILLTLFMHLAVVCAQVNIWDGMSGGRHVELYPYLAEGGDGSAVIVCPGGSYFWHDMVNEGEVVAHWLQSNGVTAFVLRYRTAYVPAFVTHFRLLFRGNRYPDALDDLRQALAYVRSNATVYGVRPDRIGVMGFSAGGHLAMCSVDLLPRTEWPAFVVPIYPVVTMSKPCVHKRSRRGLLGDNMKHNVALCDSLSMEDHVPDDCPPVFLMNCKDDPIVDSHNAELLDSALTAKGVKHTFIQYRTGGHGFGASDSKETSECQQWKNEFIRWFRALNFNNNER